MATGNNATEMDDSMYCHNVAKGGSGLSINSSDDDDDEMCNISKAMKGNVIEDDNEQRKHCTKIYSRQLYKGSL